MQLQIFFCYIKLCRVCCLNTRFIFLSFSAQRKLDWSKLLQLILHLKQSQKKASYKINQPWYFCIFLHDCALLPFLLLFITEGLKIMSVLAFFCILLIFQTSPDSPFASIPPPLFSSPLAFGPKFSAASMFNCLSYPSQDEISTAWKQTVFFTLAKFPNYFCPQRSVTVSRSGTLQVVLHGVVTQGFIWKGSSEVTIASKWSSVY